MRALLRYVGRQPNLITRRKVSVFRFRHRCPILAYRFEDLGVYGSNPPVAAAFDGLNEDRVVGGIAQGIAQAHDGAADALLKIHKDVGRPKCPTKFFASDYF